MSTKSQIVADGPFRFQRAKAKAAEESVEMKYAAQLAQAAPEEKQKILARITAEKAVQEKTLAHKPSAQSLW